MLGNIDGGSDVQGMTRKELLAPFIRSFATTDTAKGGCPEVPVPL